MSIPFRRRRVNPDDPLGCLECLYGKKDENGFPACDIPGGELPQLFGFTCGTKKNKAIDYLFALQKTSLLVQR